MSEVKNPYTFNITGNVSFSANIEADVPDVDTNLFYSYGKDEFTVTIPAGVKVIFIEADADSEPDDDLDVEIGSLNKRYDIDNSNTGYARASAYVGVTPGKQYTFYRSINSNTGTDSAGVFYAKYSKSINAKTPDVTDY